LATIDDSSSSPDSEAVVIFKHSTSCAISMMAKRKFESSWETESKISVYYLDLIRYRNISNEIAIRYDVRHESPQVLAIVNGKCIYHASHHEIDSTEIIKAINK